MTAVAEERKYTGMMSEMNESGDTKIIWDKDNAAEVEVARAAFDKLTREKRYAAFGVKKDGEKGMKISSFDPEAEKIILVPPIQGG